MSIKKCIKTYCPISIKHGLKSFLPNVTSKNRKNKNIIIPKNNVIINTSNAMPSKKKIAEHKKALRDSCKQFYCNPTCKNTAFESKSKIKSTFLRKVRENTIGNKENVLKNGFYEKLSKSHIKKLKKQGALSACYESHI